MKKLVLNKTIIWLFTKADKMRSNWIRYSLRHSWTAQLKSLQENGSGNSPKLSHVLCHVTTKILSYGILQ